MEITREIEASRKPLYDRAKRLFDVVVGGILLIATSPLFFIIALLVKLTSRGPVFYRQTRLGKDGRAFRVYKFRTMVADADNYLREWLSKNPALRREFEEYFKLKNDPRVTPVGRLLRKG